MKTKQQEERQADDEKQVRTQLHAVIAEQVIHVLGRPNNGYHQVLVRKLWGERYRVNVLVGQDMLSATIAHSFFLILDEGGNIVTANPKIMKKY